MEKNLRKKLLSIIFLNIDIRNNKLSKINLVPFEINKDSLKLISSSKFRKHIRELNKFLPRSDKIWHAYLNRINSRRKFCCRIFIFFIILMNTDIR